MASFCERETETHKIHLEVSKIAFTNDYEKILLKLSDEFVESNRIPMVIDIFESAHNQLHDNYNIALKLAQLYLGKNPNSSVEMCEEVMQQNPKLIRAFILWCDAMNLSGRGGEAVSELVKRLEDDSLDEVVKRQLNHELETLRIQGNEDIPYVPSSKKDKDKVDEYEIDIESDSDESDKAMDNSESDKESNSDDFGLDSENEETNQKTTELEDESSSDEDKQVNFEDDFSSTSDLDDDSFLNQPDDDFEVPETSEGNISINDFTIIMIGCLRRLNNSLKHKYS